MHLQWRANLVDPDQAVPFYTEVGVRITSTPELSIQDLQRIQQQQLQEMSEFQKGTRSKEQSKEKLTVSKGILTLTNTKEKLPSRKNSKASQWMAKNNQW